MNSGNVLTSSKAITGKTLEDGTNGASEGALAGWLGSDRSFGAPSIDTLRIDGTEAADQWRVDTGLAFDNPGVYVFNDSGASSSQVSLSGVRHVEVNGLAGADRLVVENVFGTRSVAIRGGTTQISGIESLTWD